MNMMNVDELIIDGHGNVNILSSCSWFNLKIKLISFRYQISGFDLNTLLYCMCIIYGAQTLEEDSLPGGLYAWEEVLESFFIGLVYMIDIDDVLIRLEYILERVIFLIRTEEELINRTIQSSIDIKSDDDIRYNSNQNSITLFDLLHGFITFLYYWITNFNIYLNDETLLNFIQKLDELEDRFEDNSIYKLFQWSYVRFKELQGVSQHILKVRHGITFGIYESKQINTYIFPSLKIPKVIKSMEEPIIEPPPFSPAATPMIPSYLKVGYNLPGYGNQSQNPSAPSHQEEFPSVLTPLYSERWNDSTFIPAHSFYFFTIQPSMICNPYRTYPYLLESIQKQSHQILHPFSTHSNNSQPQYSSDDHLPFSTWGDPASFNNPSSALIKSFHQTTPNSTNTKPFHPSRGTHPTSEPYPPPHITKEFQFQQDPIQLAHEIMNYSLSSCRMDLIEIARQITLLDHAMFITIPLHIFFTSTYSAPRYQHVKRSELRRFIDRFNATTLWVMESILDGSSPEDRANKICFFIQLAVHLHEDLHNYHSLMAILAALQQASIARLKLTFSHIPRNHSNQLTRLQKVMSGSRNYQRYREEISRLSLHFVGEEEPDEEEHHHPQHHSHGAPHQSTSNVSKLRRKSMSILSRSTSLPADDDRDDVASRAQEEDRHGHGEYDWFTSIHKRLQSSTGIPYGPTFTGEDLKGGASAATAVGGGMSRHRLASDESSNTPLTSRSNEEEIRLISPTFTPLSDPAEERICEAVVPHIGAHLAEITTIMEGNSDYLSDFPHLFNAEKLNLLSGSLSALHKMQKLIYRIVPIRVIITALNHIYGKYTVLLTSESSERWKILYQTSLIKEPHHPIQTTTTTTPAAATTGSSTSNMVMDYSRISLKSPFISPSSSKNTATNPPTTTTATTTAASNYANFTLNRKKYQKSNAYERITHPPQTDNSPSFSTGKPGLTPVLKPTPKGMAFHNAIDIPTSSLPSVLTSPKSATTTIMYPTIAQEKYPPSLSITTIDTFKKPTPPLPSSSSTASPSIIPVRWSQNLSKVSEKKKMGLFPSSQEVSKRGLNMMGKLWKLPKFNMSYHKKDAMDDDDDDEDELEGVEDDEEEEEGDGDDVDEGSSEQLVVLEADDEDEEEDDEDYEEWKARRDQLDRENQSAQDT